MPSKVCTVLRPRVASMGRRERDIYEHAVRAVIAQAAEEKRDIYEHAVLAVIAQAASETERAGGDEPRPGGGMRGIWIGLALSLPFWGLIIWWLLS
jgi:hypothetical protein